MPISNLCSLQLYGVEMPYVLFKRQAVLSSGALRCVFWIRNFTLPQGLERGYSRYKTKYSVPLQITGYFSTFRISAISKGSCEPSVPLHPDLEKPPTTATRNFLPFTLTWSSAARCVLASAVALAAQRKRSGRMRRDLHQGSSYLGGEDVPLKSEPPSRAFGAKIWHLKLGWSNFLVIPCWNLARRLQQSFPARIA